MRSGPLMSLTGCEKMMNVVTPGVMASYSLPPFKILILDYGAGMPELDESLAISLL